MPTCAVNAVTVVETFDGIVVVAECGWESDPINDEASASMAAQSHTH